MITFYPFHCFPSFILEFPYFILAFNFFLLLFLRAFLLFFLLGFAPIFPQSFVVVYFMLALSF